MKEDQQSTSGKSNKSEENSIISFLIEKIPFLEGSIIFCFIVLLVLFIFDLMKSYIPINVDTTAFQFNSNENKINLFDAFLGITSILIGLITVAYVEKNNQKRMEDNDLILKKIHSKLHSLNVLDETKKRFKAIEDVLKLSQKENNEFYMLSYGVKYGQFLLTNLNVIEEHRSLEIKQTATKADSLNTNTNGFKRKSQKINAWRVFDRVKDLHTLSSNITNLISNLAEENRLNLGCLKREKYKHFVRTRILKDKTVLFAAESQDITISEDCCRQDAQQVYIGPREGWNNVFIFNKRDQATNNEERIEELIKEITGIDFDIRDRIKFTSPKNDFVNDGVNELLNERVYELDYVPFQFFLCAPIVDDQRKERVSGWSAVVVYTDYYNIGKKDSVVAFQTDSYSFCKSLKETFHELVHSTEAKNQFNAFLKNCFHSSNQINFINNVMPTKDGSDNPVSAIALDDIFAKEYLTETYKNLDLEFKSDSKYIYKDEEIVDLSMFFIESSFSIGLFHNSLTMKISQMFPDQKKLPKENFSFFKLIPRKKRLEGDTIMEPSINKVEILCENQNTTVCAEENYTYALLTKCKIEKRWTFVFGGLDAVGTRHIKSCMEEFKRQMVTCNFQKKFEITEVTPFIAVFKIKTNGETHINDVSLYKLTIMERGILKSTSFDEEQISGATAASSSNHLAVPIRQ